MIRPRSLFGAALGALVLAAPSIANERGTDAEGAAPRSNVRRVEVGGPLGVAPPSANSAPTGEAGSLGGPGLAVRAAKILTAEWQGRSVVDNGVLLMKDGVIEVVGPARDVEIPDGYEVRDVGANWLMPGLVEMHCHVAGAFGLNDTVFLTNPGVRASSDVIPGNPLLRRGLAAGVTTALYIPGSGTNIGGQGILMRTGFDEYERAELRNPGSMKLAQAGNPERWMLRPNRSLMNWHTRNTFKRGIAYAKQWEEYERTGQGKPKLQPQWEIFRSLRKNHAQVSTHTQIYQVVHATLTMIHDELGIPVFIDHGTFDSWRLGEEVEKREIFAIVGPRAIDVPTRGFINWSGSNPERIQGCAAGYQANGVTRVGFNTDSPVIPQEELQMQAAMGVRYGFDNRGMDAVRGLTIVPAMSCGLGDAIGSLEAGKIADVVVITGDPADPRSHVSHVWQSGETVYEIESSRRLW
ncbi:MAG: amidohydrolase family protein [Planctomycetota bacterium]